jgi:sulfide dehydrogenase cytochrome subunit
MLAETCVGCHGAGGSSAGPAIPSIAGIDKEYFVESMEEYQKGERPATIMDRLAKGYTEEEIKRMADYFNKQKLMPMEQTVDKKLASSGKKLHEKYCEKCHEEGGRVADGSAILAGQWMPYLTYSFDDFLSGHREMPKKMQSKMQDVKEKVGNDGFKQLTHFYASQR